MIVLKESREPQVGIFFYKDGEILADMVSKDNHTHGVHSLYWSELERTFPEFRDISSFHIIPRGRVSWFEEEGYIIEVDKILENKEFFNKLMAVFNIPRNGKIEFRSDAHYDSERSRKMTNESLPLKESTVPQVGLFYKLDRTIISSSIPYQNDYLAVMAEMENSTHAALWNSIQRAYPEYGKWSMERLPRGRVSYDRSGKTFILSISPDLNNESDIAKIKEEFNLYRSPVEIDADDPTYEVKVN